MLNSVSRILRLSPGAPWLAALSAVLAMATLLAPPLNAQRATGKRGGPQAGATGVQAKPLPKGGLVSPLPEPDEPFFVPLEVRQVLPPDAPVFAREGEVVSVGMPFARGELTSEKGVPSLSVMGTAAFQAKTLEAWPDGSVKWAKVSFLTSVASAQPIYSHALMPGHGTSPGAPVATKQGGLVRMDTGPLKLFASAFPFQPLQRVVVDGIPVVQAGSEAPFHAVAADGSPLHVLPGVSLKLEDNGPALAVLRAEGSFSVDGVSPLFDFTLRLSASAGSRVLGVDLTLRNARPDAVTHAEFSAVELMVPLGLGPGAEVVMAAAADSGEQVEIAFPLAGTNSLGLHISKVESPVVGDDPGSCGTPEVNVEWNAPVPWAMADVDCGGEVKQKKVYLQGGYEILVGDQALPGHRLVDPVSDPLDRFPNQPFVDAGDGLAGVTVALRDWTEQWPAAVTVEEGGPVRVGFFPEANGKPYQLVWQQHDRRVGSLTFRSANTPAASDPALARLTASVSLDAPLAARASDYLHYDRAGVFPYRLVSKAQQQQVLDALDISAPMAIASPVHERVRYFRRQQTGGKNNYAYVEDLLVGQWLRHGSNSAYLVGLDRARYEADWAVRHSDGFVYDGTLEAPDADVLTTNHQFDFEHRYLDGLLAAWHLTGDVRYREALVDEGERLLALEVFDHERSTYQTLRALALAYEFTGDPALGERLEERLQYFASKDVQPTFGQAGSWGWEGAPSEGSEGFVVFDSFEECNKVGSGSCSTVALGDRDDLEEEYVSRPFWSASLGPLAFYHVARVTDSAHAVLADGRLFDLARWTAKRLYAQETPGEWRLGYEYQVTLAKVTKWEQSDFHPILTAMGEAFHRTGDTGFLEVGIQQLQSAGAHGDLRYFTSRPDCQHFYATLRDALDLGDVIDPLDDVTEVDEPIIVGG
jgi:hypothetical protein